MFAKQQAPRVEYCRSPRCWIIWYGGYGHEVYVQGRADAEAMVAEVVRQRRAELAALTRKMHTQYMAARSARAGDRWISRPLCDARRILKRHGLVIVQGHVAIKTGLIPDANPTWHYVVDAAALAATDTASTEARAGREPAEWMDER